MNQNQIEFEYENIRLIFQDIFEYDPADKLRLFLDRIKSSISLTRPTSYGESAEIEDWCGEDPLTFDDVDFFNQKIGVDE